MADPSGCRVMLRLAFWGKVLNMGKQRLVRRVYEASRAKHAGGAKGNWASVTHEWLTKLGLEQHWTQVGRAVNEVETVCLEACKPT